MSSLFGGFSRLSEGHKDPAHQVLVSHASLSLHFPNIPSTEINEGYQERLARLLKFNGVPVKNLAHLEVKQGRERVKGMGARRVAFLMLSSVLAHWMARPRPTWQFTYSDSY